MSEGSRRLSLEARLKKYSRKNEKTGCIEWIGYRDVYGYAVGGYRREGVQKNRKIHRLVLERKLGRALRPDEWALHTCDVRNCVNPDHLYPGDAQANNEDMHRRGRWRSGKQDNRGEKNPNRKLTAEEIAYIRRVHEPRSRGKPGSTGTLAQKFGVHRSQIQRIVRGEAWKD